MIRADLSKYHLDHRLEFMLDCQKCPLAPGRGQAARVVPGVGNLDAAILLVGEAPGPDEDEFGFPFVGWSHQLIEWLEQKLEIENLLQIAFIANAANCFPGLNTAPTKGEINACRSNLDFIVDRMKNLKLIIPIGRIALQTVEGSDSILSTRQGFIGALSWRPRSRLYRNKEVYSIPIKHPAYLASNRIENTRGREKELREYLAQLEFIAHIIRNLDRVEQLDVRSLYEYRIAWTEQEAFDVKHEMLTNPEIWRLQMDFETTRIQRQSAIPIFVAFSWAPYKAVGIPIYQNVESPIKTTYKKKKGKGTYENGYQLLPYFSDDFIDRFFVGTKSDPGIRVILGEYPQPTDRPRPFLETFKFGFEKRVALHLGMNIVPRREQLQFEDQYVDGKRINFEIPHYDSLLAARLVTTLHSIKLENLLAWMLPLETGIKKQIGCVLSKVEVSETGFQYLAIKNPVELEVIKEWSKPYNEYLVEVEKYSLAKAAHAKKLKELKKADADKAKYPKFGLSVPVCSLSDGAKKIMDEVWIMEENATRYETLAYRACNDTDLQGRVSTMIWQLLQEDDGEFKLNNNLDFDPFEDL